MFEQFRAEECAKKLNTHITRGLSEQEAGRRLLANGRNELKEKRKETAVEMFWSQLNDPLIFVLLIAALVSILLGEYSDAMIIGTVVILNALKVILHPTYGSMFLVLRCCYLSSKDISASRQRRAFRS